MSSDSIKKLEIGIEYDKLVNVDVEKCIAVLHVVCKNLGFKALPDRKVDEHSQEYVNFATEKRRIRKRFDRSKDFYYVYLTGREYDDNYFYHIESRIAVASSANWEHYTPLPLENGFLYFIASFLSRELDHSVSHDENTGCIYDFLWDKTGVDRCLRMGHVCDGCRKRMLKAIGSDKQQRAIADDVAAILDAVANTSRWSKSVYTILEDETIKDLSWESFEDAVADYYRGLGAEVKQNCNVAGFQVDAFVVERTASGEVVRSIVECKFYKEKVGNRVVNDFGRVVSTLRESGKTDRGVMVSYSGFTPDAHLVAEHANVKLLQFKDLGSPPHVKSAKAHEKQAAVRDHSCSSPPKNGGGNEEVASEIFVMMPFSTDLDDLFYFGIYETIKECGAACVRLDQMAFTGGIVDNIYKHIESAKLLVAEVTQRNPNVYYELGYAHALKKPVILLTSDIQQVPFDIRGYNHIVYSSIKDLRKKLSERLKALLSERREDVE